MRDPLEVQVVCPLCAGTGNSVEYLEGGERLTRTCATCHGKKWVACRPLPDSYAALLMDLGRLTANYREDLLGTERRLQFSAYEAAHAAVRAHPDHQEGA